MSRLFIDGYEWVEADYMTVNKDLHVKGDFILDGGGSLAYDAIITGSIKVTGPTLGSFGSFTRITGWTDGIGTVKKTVGSFGVLAVGGQSRLHGALYGSLGSFSRVTIKGSAYGRTFYGSLGSFTRVPLVNVNIVGAAPALVKTLNGTAQSNPMGIAVDGSWVYIADANQSRIQKRKKSDFSYVSAFSTLTWDVRALAVDHLNAAGERGSYIYAVHKNNIDGVWMGMKKIRTSDMGLQRELRGSWPRGGGNYGSFLMGASGWFNGIAVREGSVYAADYNRVYKFDRGLTIGTVLISPAKLGVNSHPDGLTTNGTNIFLTTGYTSDSNSVRRYDMLGSMIEQYTGIQNWPWNIVWDKGYLHVANANNLGLQKVEKYQIAPLQKVMEFTTRQPTFGIDADGSWYWLSEVSWGGGATAFVEQWTKGAGNITGAGLIVTAGSFETVVGHLGRFHGTMTVDKAGSFGNEVRAGTFRAGKGSFITVAAKGTVRADYGSFNQLRGSGSFTITRMGSISRLWGSFRAIDRLGSLTFVIQPAGSAQARIGMGKNVYLGSMVDAFHVWSTGAELRLRQSYGQVTRLWVDQAVLNISKSNFGSPFAAAISVTPGSSNKVGLEIYGTKSQSANFFKIYRNSAGLLVLTSGTQYSLRTYGTAQMNKFQGSYKKLVQGGSAKPGSAGYIIFGRAFAAPPMAVLTMKDFWYGTPSKNAPRIKKILSGSMVAFGSPGGYLMWQAVGSAY